VKAEKAAECAANINAQNTQREQQKSQVGKRKASQASSLTSKRQKCGGIATACAASPEATSATLAAPPKVNLRGRTINLPHK
jgi:hypothetical protein